MNRIGAWMAPCCAALLLAACGGGGGNGFGTTTPAATTPAPTTPKVSVDDLPTGSYVVSTGDADSPTVGKYYAAADGSRLVVFGDSDDHAKQAYKRDAGGAWVGVPASDKDVTVTLLQSNALADAGGDIAKLAGRYRTGTTAGVVADFTLTAEGAIVAGSSVCKLSGKVSASVLPNTLKLSLSTSTDACGGLPATASGVLALDTDYAPARFRLLADNGAQWVDLWAFAD
ncbi:hypothetical protein QTH97_18835 [Variovorax sp. J22R24]|uniref:hypothetical protein n=1 Tax=Variovorax gracilis TaxID=3053502 RepID=UPI002576C27A|nr:hypothetical protein [Variovorax sp. J22R24]MDM0107009.1 hypothetical protein [Variovorax sp. J22R24]